MSDDSVYHVRRGKTPGLVDDVASQPRSMEEEEVGARSLSSSLPVELNQIASRTATPVRSIDLTGLALPSRPPTATPSRSMDPRTLTAPIEPRTLTPPSMPRTTTAPLARSRTTTAPAMPRTTTAPVMPRTTTPPPRTRTMTAPMPPLAQGSAPHLVPVGLDLDDLADVPTGTDDLVPVIERTPTAFGPNQLVVEYHGDRVAIVLPGVVRLIGSVEDGRKLAELLARRPR